MNIDEWEKDLKSRPKRTILAVAKDHLMLCIQKGNRITQLQAQLAEAQRARINAENMVKEIRESLYGQRLSVAGWHMNGEHEPLDNWFDENGWEIETAKGDTNDNH